MPSKPSSAMAARYAAIYQVLRSVPRGKVVTYGQLAELAGMPGAARIAGAALRLSDSLDLPWQRVVGKRGASGRIAILDPVGAAMQRQLLVSEGVAINDTGLIRLAEFGWLPLDEKRLKQATALPGHAARLPPRPRSGSKRKALPLPR